MTGRLLQEMTYYFLKKLKKKGFGKKPECWIFNTVFPLRIFLDKELEELHFVEQEWMISTENSPYWKKFPGCFGADSNQDWSVVSRVYEKNFILYRFKNG